MLFPIDIRSVGIVSPFGVNNYHAVSKIFEYSADCDVNWENDYQKMSMREYLSPYQTDMPDIRYMDITTKKAIIATRGSLLGANVRNGEIHHNSRSFGLVLATSKGPTFTRRKLFRSFAERNHRSVSATLFSNCGYNIAASLVATYYGMRGPNITIAGDEHIALSLMERSSVLLEKRCIDYVIAGFTGGGAENDAEPKKIDMADFACVLFITRADPENLTPRSLRLQAVDANAAENEYNWKDHPQTGNVYGAGFEPNDEQSTISLKRLNLPVNKEIQENRGYLPFFHLALLWGSEQLKSCYKFWMLPIKAPTGTQYIKISSN